jgi:L,D-peptidoglycan transpeptidase YkuD (ErfK/YbiS/YcfS/YnhG family)
MRSYSKKCVRKSAYDKGRLREIVVRARPGVKTQGLMRAGPVVFPCALGRGGISAAKREGDGATPLGPMRLLGGYFRADRLRPGATGLPMAMIRADLGWCEVPDDRNYNRAVTIPYAASHETMRRQDRLYDICIVLDWNIRPRRRGRGSAIFFHLARPGFTPTEGCVAVTLATMRRLLPHLSARTILRVAR